MELKVHDRFKYAEEHAHRLDNEGNTSWKMWRAPDKCIYEDGETYTIIQYVVEWNE